jgi:hypothetical protein
MKYRLTQLLPGRGLGVLAYSIALMVLMVAGCGAQKDTEPPLEKISMKKVSVEGGWSSYGSMRPLPHGLDRVTKRRS